MWAKHITALRNVA